MRDVFVVRGGQRAGDLRAVTQHFADRQRALSDAGCQGFAFHEFHYDVVGTDVVERADMGMIQGRDRAGLPPKTVVKQLPGDFEGDRAAETRIGGAVYRAHAALSDLMLNPVGPELFANADRPLRLRRTGVLQEGYCDPPRLDDRETLLVVEASPFSEPSSWASIDKTVARSSGSARSSSAFRSEGGRARAA